jgi:hypothetical protein
MSIKPLSPLVPIKKSLHPLIPLRQIKKSLHPLIPLRQIKKSLHPLIPLRQIKKSLHPLIPLRSIKKSLHPLIPLRQIKKSLHPLIPLRSITSKIEIKIEYNEDKCYYEEDKCDQVEDKCDQVEDKCDQVEDKCDQVEDKCDYTENKYEQVEDKCDYTNEGQMLFLTEIEDIPSSKSARNKNLMYLQCGSRFACVEYSKVAQFKFFEHAQGLIYYNMGNVSFEDLDNFLQFVHLGNDIIYKLILNPQEIIQMYHTIDDLNKKGKDCDHIIQRFMNVLIQMINDRLPSFKQMLRPITKDIMFMHNDDTITHTAVIDKCLYFIIYSYISLVVIASNIEAHDNDKRLFHALLDYGYPILMGYALQYSKKYLENKNMKNYDIFKDMLLLLHGEAIMNAIEEIIEENIYSSEE